MDRGRQGRGGIPLHGTDPEGDRWFELLLRARPELGAQLSKVPPRLAEDDVVVRCPADSWRDVDLTTNELLVLAHMNGSASIGALAARTHLAPGAFARAVYALIEKRVVEPQSRQPRN